MPTRKLVLGFDPGYAHLGVAALDADTKKVIIATAFVTRPHDGTPPERLDILAGIISDVFQRQVVAVGFEDQSGVETAKQARGRSTSSSRRVHEVVGMIRLAARQAGVICEEIRPQTIKKNIVGKADASKDEVKMMVFRITNEKLGEHAADAMAVAILTLRKHQTEQRMRHGTKHDK